MATLATWANCLMKSCSNELEPCELVIDREYREDLSGRRHDGCRPTRLQSIAARPLVPQIILPSRFRRQVWYDNLLLRHAAMAQGPDSGVKGIDSTEAISVGDRRAATAPLNDARPGSTSMVVQNAPAWWIPPVCRVPRECDRAGSARPASRKAVLPFE